MSFSSCSFLNQFLSPFRDSPLGQTDISGHGECFLCITLTDEQILLSHFSTKDSGSRMLNPVISYLKSRDFTHGKNPVIPSEKPSSKNPVDLRVTEVPETPGFFHDKTQ